MYPKPLPLVFHKFSTLRAVLLLICVVASPLAAQVDRASLNGTVTDPSGAVVPGAKIEAISDDTGKEREVLTNEEGIYIIPALPVGTYTMVYSHEGFGTLRYQGIEARAGQKLTLDVQLQLTQAAAHVEVMSTAPLLERSSAESAAVMGRAAILDLPVNGRNWANLLTLAPGALDDGGGNQRTIRFAGRGRDDNNYMFDGVDATGIQEQASKSTTRLQVSEDAIEEYRVNSMLYTAEYGAGAGGQVDIVTKTGTNQFHGDGFEFLRNSALDSRSFLDLDNDPTVKGPTHVPPFRLNQFGGSFGGPIAKDKTFFFANYEGIRQFRGQTLHAFVPSASLRSQILATSPQMGPIVQVYPAGQVSTCTFNPSAPCQDIDEFTHLGAVRVREDSVLGRVDHRFSDDRTQLFVRGVYDNSFTTAPLGNLLDLQQINTHPQNYAVSLTHIFSPNVFNEVKFGLNRAPFHNPQIGVFTQNFSVATDNFEGLNNNNTDHEVGTSFGYIDNLTVQHGRHAFKMGGEVRRIRLNQGKTSDHGLDFTGGGDANLINDHLNSFRLGGSWWSLGLRHTFVLPYFQDEWKVRPNLTLNMEIRWEYYKPITEAHGRSRIFDLLRCANAVPSDPGVCPQGSAFFFPNHRNFDPRLSVAWAPTSFHDKTVIRAGYGIYHGAGQNDDLNAGLESNSDVVSLSSSDVPNLSYPIDSFLPLASTSGRTPRAIQRDRRDLYAEEWGLSVQQSLPHDLVLQTGYFGTVGHRLFARNYVNLCNNTLAERQAGICTRPLAGVGQVDIKRNDGNSTFNALQISLQRHFANGFQLATNYMWSHSINDQSVGGGESNAPENANCRECDRGPSIYDIRHNLVVSAVYDLPIGPGKRFVDGDGLAGKVLGGWQLSGVQIYHTGHPLTVTVDRSSSSLLDGNSRSDQRPDRVPGVSVIPTNRGANNWISPAAFAAPADFTWGNAGRGLVYAPITWQTDVALSKTMKVTEQVSLQFRAEAYNVFNHDQFADPVINSSNGNFGHIVSTVNFNSNNDSFAPDNTGSGTPRQFEFSLRLVF